MKRRGKNGKLAALDEVVEETRRLFRRLAGAAEEIHGEGKMFAGTRNLLRRLAHGGPGTVPQLARERGVSRQHMQVHVNTLLQEGHVEYRPNPAHRRSHLVALTPRGEALRTRVLEREAAVLGRLRIPASERELRAAAATLRALRESLEGAPWRDALEIVAEEGGRRRTGRRSRR